MYGHLPLRRRGNCVESFSLILGKDNSSYARFGNKYRVLSTRGENEDTGIIFFDQFQLRGSGGKIDESFEKVTVTSTGRPPPHLFEM
jgi:hypothetical protein